ncbi:hypothetical protein [Pelomonas cellulosilytica]|uniref:Uncharacterized protein n=1 Tax=Pelomonas cellulosilytica TaxID=2906762 RepID=A0ABS8XS23_9BURK|nr:hypothetical protein [Pelomonas sp. P8]MCE4554497.1 hypothetical protein [Pelomonas sp. P8]
MRSVLLLALVAAPAFAHDGHGAPAAHLHGWDGAGLSALAAIAGVAVWWFSKGRK